MFFGGDASALFFLLPFLQSLFLIVLIVLVVVILRRRHPDPRGRRPFAIYLCLVMFVSLFTALSALGELGAAIAQAATDIPTTGGGEECFTRLTESGAGSGNAISFESRARAQEQREDPFPQFTVEPFPTFSPEPFPDFSIPSFPEPPEPPVLRRPDVPDFPEPVTICSPTKAASGSALSAILLGIVAAVIFFFHLQQMNELLAKERNDVG